MKDLMPFEIEDVKESQTFHQLGILVLDGSGSMETIGSNNRSLAEDVNHTVREFLTFFKGSSIANNFSMSVITFDNNAKEHTPPIPLSQIDDYADYNPVSEHGGGTNIGAALERAEKIALQHLNTPGLNHTVNIVILSDGYCQNPDFTIQVADRIKSNGKIGICGCLFIPRSEAGTADTNQAKKLLEAIVSTPNNYKTVYNPTDLRKFFVASFSTRVPARILQD